ncbi:MAG: hypothetical protein ACP5KB_05850 [Thermoprotei archaeon]
MRIPLENLKVPLILMLYGFFLVLVQTPLIRLLVYLSMERGHSVLIQVLVIILYVFFNIALLYSWYKLTTYLKNRELMK